MRREARHLNVVARSRAGARLGRCGVAVIAAALLGVFGTPAQADTAPPSAFGSVFVTWIVASPAYAHTGTVAAIGSLMSCSTDCNGLWVSHDGGATWRRAAARNWQPSRVVIAADGNGHETFFGASS